VRVEATWDCVPYLSATYIFVMNFEQEHFCNVSLPRKYARILTQETAKQYCL